MSNLIFTTPARAGGFASGTGNRRYTISHQTPTTAITGQTSFDATTPTFILYKTTSNTTKRTILSNFSLAQSGTVAGGAISVVLAVDPTNRYSAGGTAVVPQLTSTQQVTSGTTPDFTFRYNATASAAGSNDSAPRYTTIGEFPAVTGTMIPTVDCQDEFVIAGPGSILVYVYAATTGPTLRFCFEVIEEPVSGGF